MLIHVMYPGNTYDYVREFILDTLIETGQITSFHRADGWVSIGDGPLRTEFRQNAYDGVEKRALQQSL
jgi:hypothetical protein